MRRAKGRCALRIGNPQTAHGSLADERKVIHMLDEILRDGEGNGEGTGEEAAVEDTEAKDAEKEEDLGE